jgi:hypothetical protein
MPNVQIQMSSDDQLANFSLLAFGFEPSTFTPLTIDEREAADPLRFFPPIPHRRLNIPKDGLSAGKPLLSRES